ncbi:hypothetical protein GCM10017786_45950 [Amycolatopsis deserti]|uniref:Uncharacterized protein n=1 Tax=Amycolatopsis deserti TaxID=185696 RepID=A0ABQ3J7A8_9PSEU|nr:hypothetical protein [Amycolatopsis deserti]GHF07150.1 hypothetical protein GCM10017786_45950 [Amycolatopsis deserti]
MTRPGRFARLLLVLLAAVLAITGTPVALAQTTAPAPAGCAAEQAALASVQSQITAHNAKPHVFTLPRQAGELAAYDAEAAQLNAAQATAIQNLQACEQRVQAMAQARQRALDDLLDRANSDYTPAPPDAQQLRRVREARDNLAGSGWRPPSPARPGPDGQWNVPENTPLRELYDAVRRTTPQWPFPNVRLQGAPRPRIGDPDPSGYSPGGAIGRAPGPRGGPNVSPDHIIPIAQMVYLRGFTRLSPENMLAIANSPLNLQWMSRLANSAKSSKSMGAVAKADPAWAQSQTALERSTLARLQDIIDRLLANGG